MPESILGAKVAQSSEEHAGLKVLIWKLLATKGLMLPWVKERERSLRDGIPQNTLLMALLKRQAVRGD